MKNYGRRHLLKSNRPIRWAHLIANYLMDGPVKVGRSIKVELVTFFECRRKEGEAMHMVPMQM